MIHRSTALKTDGRVARAILFTLLAGWLLVPEAFAEERLSAARYKSGPATRRAFRELVAKPNKAIVRISDEDKAVALGAIMTSDGEILTKASELGSEIDCELYDGRSFSAEVIAADRDADLALIKIDASDLPVLEWDRGPRPEVGQWFVTPGLKELPISVGIVSVANRTIPPDRGVLGISITDEDLGPRITKVYPNSGAAKAGLKVGDVVTRIAGRDVKSGRALTSSLGRLRPGDSLKLYVIRDEEELELKATLGYPMGEMTKMLDRGSFQNRLGGELSLRRGGFTSIIQHDSVLAPEECGGPVIGLSGKALGLNIARGGRTESYALPAQSVLEVYDSLKAEYLASQKTED